MEDDVSGNGGVLPTGVSVCPQAEEFLERALECLRRGLVVRAWAETEKARRELDKVTDGPSEGRAE